VRRQINSRFRAKEKVDTNCPSGPPHHADDVVSLGSTYCKSKDFGILEKRLMQYCALKVEVDYMQGEDGIQGIKGKALLR
jgi:hypothetical protein